MDNVMIRVKNVTKKFGREKVIDAVSVEFEAGKIHGITGRNGSGKSVLLKIICGLVLPDEGEVIVQGKRIGTDTDFPPDAGIIIETPGFLPHYSGFRNLQSLASLRGRTSADGIRQAISMTGLDPRSKKHVAKYSSGMNQRLGIAQAIMEDPGLLILDEPMNWLDRKGAEEIIELLGKLNRQGKTILITSHNIDDVQKLCHCVYEMDSGKLTQLL